MKKIVPVISVIAVLVVLLTIPAAAASESGVTTYTATPSSFAYQCDSSSNNYGYVSFQRSASFDGRMYKWNISAPSSSAYTYDTTFVVPISQVFSVNPTDTLSVPEMTFFSQIGASSSSISGSVSIELVAFNDDGTVARRASSDGAFGEIITATSQSYYNQVHSSNSEQLLKFPGESRSLVAGYNRVRLCLVFDLYDVPSHLNYSVSVSADTFVFSISPDSSPETPAYTPPSDEDKFSDLDGAEQDLANKNQAGLDTAGDIIADFTLTEFASGLSALIAIYNVLLPRLGWLNALISVSLALGLFSFIVGIVPTIAGKLSSSKGGKKGGKKGG